MQSTREAQQVMARDVSEESEQQLLQGFREAFGRVAATVGIITYLENGSLHGMTATALSSLSGAPPSLVASVNRENRTFRAIRASGQFGVNFLGAGLEDVALRFSRPGEDKEVPPSLLHHHSGWPLPSLDGSIATVVCDLVDSVPQFSHAILIGRITHVQTSEGSPDPLLFMERQFRRVGR